MDYLTLESLLHQAVEAGASDVHLTVESPPLLRVNGQLVRLPVPSLNQASANALVEGLLTESQRETLAQQGQLDFSYSLPGLGRFRVNVYRQRGSLAAALRVIPRRVPSVDELRLPEVAVAMTAKHHGLILVTGPTGSGKSTTLAALIDRINNERSCHIVTLEDPIEYLHKHRQGIVNQREVGIDVINFAQGLRAVLRQDPDVILIGEMRDLETISVALTAAETGHLVLASLHTANAVQTVERIVDVFPPHQQEQVRVQLAGAIQGILAQALLPRADGQGRVAAFELLVATQAVRNLVREGKSHQLVSAIQTGGRYGMCTMESSLRRLLDAHMISEEEYRARVPGQPGPGLV